MATSVSNVQSIHPQLQQANYSNNSVNTNVVSKEYYVKVPNRTKKRYHALKFHTSQVDMASWNKAEMARDLTNQQAQRLEAESLSKQGSNESKDQTKRRRPFQHMPKKISPEDQPWILTNKSTDKGQKQYIGKKSVSENSSYFVFIKCADGGFEAWPLEDWYSFAPHKTYKTLNHEEAEEEYKRRNKVLNKYTIMANKRKVDGAGGEDEEEFEGTSSSLKGPLSSFGSKSKDNWVSDDDDDKKKKKKNYKASNLSDDDDDDDKDNRDEDEFESKSSKLKKKPNKRKDIGSDDEVKAKEDSDDGDHEGIEKDYSSSDSDLDSGPDTSKFDEKYEQKGIDEEEAIKAQNKSDDSESEEDEGLTEEGKAYKKKLLAKDEDGNESDETDELFKGKSGKDEDSKDSSSTFDDSDLESDFAKQKKNKLAQNTDNKLKRKASDELLANKSKKKQNKNSTAITHDESSSSSSTSAQNLNKSSKTAAVIAAAAANANKTNTAPTSATPSAPKPATSTTSKDTGSTGLSEEEVKRYLLRKPMSSKELLQKFKSKTQSTMTNEQIVQSLRAILDKLKPKMNEKNGVKYLSL